MPKVKNHPDNVWATKGVRVATLMTISLMAGSLTVYAEWLSSSKHRGGLIVYLVVIAFNFVGWAIGIELLRRRFNRTRDST